MRADDNKQYKFARNPTCATYCSRFKNHRTYRLRLRADQTPLIYKRFYEEIGERFTIVPIRGALKRFTLLVPLLACRDGLLHRPATPSWNQLVLRTISAALAIVMLRRALAQRREKDESYAQFMHRCERLAAQPQARQPGKANKLFPLHSRLIGSVLKLVGGYLFFFDPVGIFDPITQLSASIGFPRILACLPQ